MELHVSKTTRLTGSIKAPPSKSYTHRAVIIACMAQSTRVENPLDCNDTERTVAMLCRLGATVVRDDAGFAVTGFDGTPDFSEIREFDVGESGTLLRFLLPIVALGDGEFIVDGRGSIRTRGNRESVEVLRSWGVDITGVSDEHTVPLTVRGNGRLRGGDAQLAGTKSSQVVSSLLIVAPHAQQDTTLHVGPGLVSRPYVDVTVDVLSWAGVQIERDGHQRFTVKHGQRLAPSGPFVVHGDHSSAAFPIAAAVLGKSDVEITDLVMDEQGDAAIIPVLQKMGADISHDVDQGSVTVRGPTALRGIDVDCRDTPDMAPILTTLGCFAEGTTRIVNVGHLKGKESNRLEAPASELRKLGADITTTEDSIVVHGSALHGGEVSACNDHRVAMSLAVAGLALDDGVVITGSESIAKSYPDFVRHMQALGAPLQESEPQATSPERTIARNVPI